MRKNDAGLTILEKGDVVKLSTRKDAVLYTVTVDEDMSSFVTARSHNTNKPKTEHVSRWILVRAVQDLEPVDTDDTNEEEEPVKETSAYAKAVLFALNKLQKHVYAGTVRSNVKAKRRALGRRQKASRKANR